MNRIENKFKELKKKNRKAFIAYIMAGDPSLSVTKRLIFELEKQGVDLIELGIPYSDPLADGPTIQAAGYRALEKGTNLKDILSTVSDIRSKVNIPIILMSYFNPIFKYGINNFVKDAGKNGIDGVIIPDLPPEEGKDFVVLAKKSNLDIIFLIAPTSPLSRIKKISSVSRGFIYYVSLTGVTGARESLASEIGQFVKKIKAFTSKPVCVGFGVSKPEQIKNILKFGDGVIVGSAIVKLVEQMRGNKEIVVKTGAFVKTLVEATRKAGGK